MVRRPHRIGSVIRESLSSLASARLDLVPLDASTVETLLGGRRAAAASAIGAAVPDDWPHSHDQSFLRLRLGQLQRDPASPQWLIRAIVLRAEGTMVGHVGFHEPPGVNGPAREGALEVGYTIFAPYRGRGLATEAVEALIRWAHDERGIRDFIASISPENAPSLAVVRKLGFVHIGEQWDEEDGLELVFERSLPDEPHPS